MKLASYSKPKLRSKLNLFYALMHGTGITAAFIALGGLALHDHPMMQLICGIISAVWLLLALFFQSRRNAYRDELQRRYNEPNNPNP